MTDFNIQLPQDGSGKRIKHKIQLEISYQGLTGELNVGDVLTGLTSGVTGAITYTHIITGTTGHVYIDVDHESPLILTDTENLQVSGVTVAQSNGSGVPYYIPVTMVIGGNSGFNEQKVDKAGAAYTRFTEGSPQFNAFGRLQVSGAVSLGEYAHPYDSMLEAYQDVVVGSGVCSYESDSSNVLLTIGTDIGAKMSRATHKYHKYQPGVSQEIGFTASLGDAGKAGVTRWMGYGEDYETGSDGIYFVMEDTTMKLVIKSSTSGAVINTEYVAADWNGDRLDGNGGQHNLTEVILNQTKNNIYWIDFQIGAGRVRFGAVIDGVRVVIHEVHHANNINRTFMRTGSLPITYGQLNTTATGSSSELRVWNVVVSTEGDFSPYEHRFSYQTATLVTINSDTATPVLSFRPKQVFNTKGNRMWIIPRSIEATIVGDPCVLDMVREGLLTGATWAVNPDTNSGCELDTAATAITDGKSICASPIVSELNFHVEDVFGYDKEMSIRKADVTAAPIYYTLTARNMEAVKSAQLFLTINWREIR